MRVECEWQERWGWSTRLSAHLLRGQAMQEVNPSFTCFASTKEQIHYNNQYKSTNTEANVRASLATPLPGRLRPISESTGLFYGNVLDPRRPSHSMRGGITL